jgi:hypothetical protein
MNGEKRIAHRLVVGKSEGKRPLRRPRRRWADNIKIDLKYYGVVLSGLVWLRRRIGGDFL